MNVFYKHYLSKKADRWANPAPERIAENTFHPKLALMTHKQRFTSNGKGSADSRTANRQALRDGLDRIFGKRELIPTPKRERIVYGSAKRDNPAQ